MFHIYLRDQIYYRNYKTGIDSLVFNIFHLPMTVLLSDLIKSPNETQHFTKNALLVVSIVLHNEQSIKIGIAVGCCALSR